MTKFQLYQELNNLSGRGEYVRSCVISFFNFSVPVTIASESYLPLKFHGGRGRNRAENSADLINSFSDILAPRITEGTKGAKELEGRGGGGGRRGRGCITFHSIPGAHTRSAHRNGVSRLSLYLAYVLSSSFPLLPWTPSRARARRREIRPRKRTKGGDKGKRRPRDTRTMVAKQWADAANLTDDRKCPIPSSDYYPPLDNNNNSNNNNNAFFRPLPPLPSSSFSLRPGIN